MPPNLQIPAEMFNGKLQFLIFCSVNVKFGCVWIFQQIIIYYVIILLRSFEKLPNLDWEKNVPLSTEYHNTIIYI